MSGRFGDFATWSLILGSSLHCIGGDYDSDNHDDGLRGENEAYDDSDHDDAARRIHVTTFFRRKGRIESGGTAPQHSIPLKPKAPAMPNVGFWGSCVANMTKKRIPHRKIVGSHRPLSSSFLGLPYRILNMNHKKELLRGLWVVL